MGFFLSKRKPLWNDELFTQTYSIERKSYTEILGGKVPEANNAPLFYIVQKTTLALAQFKLPFTWQGEWNVSDRHSQIIMRIIPNLFMSLSILSLFYFFSSLYSLSVGFYALATALASLLFWEYWVEVRPYSLWILLTTWQALILCADSSKVQRESQVHRLIICNILLSLTVTSGFLQVMIVSLLVFLGGERRWSKYFWLSVLPSLICFYYYSHSPKFKFWVSEAPFALILDNFPMERFFLLFFCLLVSRDTITSLKTHLYKLTQREGMFLGYLGALLVASFLFLSYFLVNKSFGTEGFAISHRYFIYLTPLSCIVAVFCSVRLLDFFKNNPWMKTNLVLFLGGFLIVRGVKILLVILN